MIVPRLKASKSLELESFWRAHLDGWRCSDLNQREYCDAHGLPLKRFGNWRAKLRHEENTATKKLLYRRGGGLSHMSSHMTKEPVPYIPSARSTPPGKRRRFSEADKKRIVAEANRPVASVSEVARRYDIAARVLFRWEQDLTPNETSFVPVTLTDPPAQATVDLPVPESAPVIVERPAPGIEVELIGGRRVRFDRDTDPETVQRLVKLLEGATP